MTYLLKNPTVLSLYITNATKLYDHKTLLVDFDWKWGFSFNPGLRTMSHYLLCPGGYSGVTGNRNAGKKAGI